MKPAKFPGRRIRPTHRLKSRYVGEGKSETWQVETRPHRSCPPTALLAAADAFFGIFGLKRVGAK